MLGAPSPRLLNFIHLFKMRLVMANRTFFNWILSPIQLNLAQLKRIQSSIERLEQLESLGDPICALDAP